MSEGRSPDADTQSEIPDFQIYARLCWMGVEEQRNQETAAGSSRALAGFPTLQWQGGLEGPRLFSDRDLIRSDPMGRRLGPVYDKPVYPANLCPIQRGGAATHSRPRTIILHNESGQCKRFL
jgi:hypothetical protein